MGIFRRQWVAGYAFASLATSSAMATGEIDAAFEKAEEAAQSGRLADMQAAYEGVLLQSPDNVRALNGKATAMAWQADYSGARATFEKALLTDSRNVGALTGLGYTYAWDGQFVAAHTQFQRALRIDPGNIDARKGIGYSYSWQEQHDLALGAFETAASMAPHDAELEEAIGHATLALGRTRDAIPHFEKALALDPGRSSASLARRAAYVAAPALEVSTRFGTTSNAGSGLRQLELVHWPEKTVRIAVKYDNSLGLDNPSISGRGENAPGYFASAQKTFRERFTLGVEIGRRDLIVDQQTIAAIQGTYFASFGALRFGIQQGRTDGGLIDDLVFGGVNFPVARRWRVEPIVYLSETGAANDREWRATVGVDYLSDAAWQIGAFLGGGSIDAADSRFSGNTTVVGVRGSYLFADKYSFHWGLRRDESPTVDFTVAEIGFTYRLVTN